MSEKHEVASSDESPKASRCAWMETSVNQADKVKWALLQYMIPLMEMLALNVANVLLKNAICFDAIQIVFSL